MHLSNEFAMFGCKAINAHFQQAQARQWATFTQKTNLGRFRKIADSQQRHMGPSLECIT